MATDVFDRLSEWPLVSREECWRAYRPAQPFSESAFQRLRAGALVSPGVSMPRRNKGQLLGQERWFSRLNLLGLNAHRLGDDAEARRLAKAAKDVEVRQEFQELVRLLATQDRDKSGYWRSPSPDQVNSLVWKICDVTDSQDAQAHHAPTRLAALVESVRSGMADLVVRAGQHILYSEVKLSRIDCHTPGAALVLYLIDLDETDELVRARPAVTFAEPDLASPSMPPHPGAYDRVVTLVDDSDADLIDQILDQDGPERPIDLTGLRVPNDDHGPPSSSRRRGGR